MEIDDVEKPQWWQQVNAEHVERARKDLEQGVKVETPNKEALRDSFYVLWVGILTSLCTVLAAGLIFALDTKILADLEPSTIFVVELMGILLLLLGFVLVYAGQGFEQPSSISLFFGLLFTTASAGMMAAPLAVAAAEHTNLVRVLTLVGLTTLVLTVVFWTTNPRLHWGWLLGLGLATLGVLSLLDLLGLTRPQTPWDWELSLILLGYIIRKWVKGMTFGFTLKNAFRTPTLLYMDIVFPLAENL